MRWSSSHLVALSSLTPPWLVLVFVCAFARSSTAAPVVVSVTAQQCGTQFTDTASSALIADIVLEGRVREKVPVHHHNHNHNHNNSPLGEGEGVTGRRDMYNAVIQVRKHIWKGKDRIQHKKLHIGKFSSSLENTDQASNVVTALRPEGDSGAVRDSDSCVGDVADGATYIFFLRDVGDEKGKYFELSALPVKKSRREARIVAKVLTDNGAEAPTIQQLKAPKTVTTGASLTLTCKAKAKPNPVFQWFFNGKEIASGRGKRIKNSKRGSRLKINKAETEHAGVYSCVATNAVGDAGKNITVKVRGFHYEPAAQTSPLPQYTTEVQTTVYDHHMNEDANASADSSVKEEEKIYKACEKQTFCFNGGTCRYIQEMQQSFCQCPESYEGKRCEKQIAHPSILKGEGSLEIFHMFAKGVRRSGRGRGVSA